MRHATCGTEFRYRAYAALALILVGMSAAGATKSVSSSMSACAEGIIPNARNSPTALLAPIRMLFHTEFVTTSLLGIKVPWKSPPRDDAETSWREAFSTAAMRTSIRSRRASST